MRTARSSPAPGGPDAPKAPGPPELSGAEQVGSSFSSVFLEFSRGFLGISRVFQGFLRVFYGFSRVSLVGSGLCSPKKNSWVLGGRLVDLKTLSAVLE